MALALFEEEIQKSYYFELSLNVNGFVSKDLQLLRIEFGPKLLELIHVTRIEYLDHFEEEFIFSAL